MSLVFSDVTNYKGLVQEYERELGLGRGYVSDSNDRLKDFAATVNLAWDDYMSIAIPASGTWQYDDSNHTKYPIIYTDIVSGQRDYNFTTDEQGNLILDIYRVAVLPSATDTLYQEIFPVDVQSDEKRAYDLLSENTTEGSPLYYDKTANGIFLDPKPDYNATNGIKIYINREANYFDYDDTTKKPGCPGIHHRYFALKPALDYARRNDLSTYNRLRDEVIGFEGDLEKGVQGSIAKYFSKRERDTRDVLEPEPITYL